MKVGDKVVSFKHGLGSGYTVYTIERETKTQFITNDGSKWSKESGRLIGRGKWDFSSLQEITPEAKKRMTNIKESREHSSTWRDIRDIKQPHHLPASRLKEILAELKGND